VNVSVIFGVNTTQRRTKDTQRNTIKREIKFFTTKLWYSNANSYYI